MNYTTFEEQVATIPYNMVKAIHCRSALRSLITTKRFLDQVDRGRNADFALAMFSDIQRAICITAFPKEHRISNTSFVERIAKTTLKMLCENDEEFAFGYLSAHRLLLDVSIRSPQQRTATMYAQKRLQLASTNRGSDLEWQLKHLYAPVEIDLAKSRRLSSPKDLFSAWDLSHGGALPGDPRHQPYDLDLALKHAGPAWSFWREWYQGFLDGKPLDWELQRRVALIPDPDWEKGPEHIARKIEEIRSEFEAEQRKPAERHKELEPSSVEHLLKAPSITANQIDAAAQDIRDAECKYLNDTGTNALPEEFQSFPSIAHSLTQISQSIRSYQTTPSVEVGLRQQIGRLNARIIELETELDKFRSSKDPVFRNAFKEQAGKSLGDWKMYGAVIGAVWLISGDTYGMKARLENLGATRDAIFGTARCAPAAPVAPLPGSTDV